MRRPISPRKSRNGLRLTGLSAYRGYTASDRTGEANGGLLVPAPGVWQGQGRRVGRPHRHPDLPGRPHRGRRHRHAAGRAGRRRGVLPHHRCRIREAFSRRHQQYPPRMDSTAGSLALRSKAGGSSWSRPRSCRNSTTSRQRRSGTFSTQARQYAARRWSTPGCARREAPMSEEVEFIRGHNASTSGWNSEVTTCR